MENYQFFRYCSKCKQESDHSSSTTIWCRKCKKEYNVEKYRRTRIQTEDHLKTCSKCKESKTHSPKSSWCKDCSAKSKKEYISRNKDIISEKMKIKRKQCPNYARKHLYKYKYNITIEDYDRMLLEQNNCCAICKSEYSGRGNKIFDVDHCHTTGKVRGLLCVTCNFSLGGFKDSVENLMTAIEYLNKQ